MYGDRVYVEVIKASRETAQVDFELINTTISKSIPKGEKNNVKKKQKKKSHKK